MATLALTALGSAVGGAIGGTFLTVSAATIGATIGGMIGARIDQGLFNPQKSQTIEGFRMDDLSVTSATEGAPIPRLYGTTKMAGNLIWATELEEVVESTTVRGPRRYGFFGPRASSTTIEYFYFTSFAVALCQGPINGILRIWADGEPLDQSLADDIRVYNGTETQNPDPFIESIQGGPAPAYRGTAYVVFERLDLENFGNRIPNMTFEVVKPSMEPGSVERETRAVGLLPDSGELSLETEETSGGDASRAFLSLIQLFRRAADLDSGGSGDSKDLTSSGFYSPVNQSLDMLNLIAPNTKSVIVTIPWYGDDLRAGSCQIKPKVALSTWTGEDDDPWRIGTLTRPDVGTVTQFNDQPAFGGTHGDRAVREFIRALKRANIRVIVYPYLMMDIPEGNTLPNPYSDNAAEVSQTRYPSKAMITCSPASGFAGTVDKTSAAVGQINQFFDNTWGYRRMIMHYANLCNSVNGVSGFLLGGGLSNLTTVRGSSNNYHAVQKLRDLAAEVRDVVGAGTKISYAADWDEYHGHLTRDGSGDRFFHLDPFWADSNVDFIGINNFMPLADWRDEREHKDQAGQSTYNLDYLRDNVLGGEGYDWYYASASDRRNQIRTPIEDPTGNKPWVFRNKDLASWWANQHFNRIGGVESASPTAWVPQSKPFWFTKYGCPAIDKGANQPSVVIDAKSGNSSAPHFSNGYRDDAMQRAYIEATQTFWNNNANNPLSSVYGSRMVDMENAFVWGWDARPYPAFPVENEIYGDTESHETGYWLNGRLGGYTTRAAVAEECAYAGYESSDIDVTQLYGYFLGYTVIQAMSVRDTLSNLGEALLFTGYEVDGVLAFKTEYTRDDFRVIDYEMLIADTTDGGEAFNRTRLDDIELPRSLRWRLLWDLDDFEGAVIQADMNNHPLTNLRAETYELTMADLGSVYASCATTLYNMWAARESMTLALPMWAIDFMPSDYIEFNYEGVSKGYMISQKTISDKVELKLNAVSVKSQDVKQRITRNPTKSFAVQRDFVQEMQMLNLPALDAETMEPLFYLAPVGNMSALNYIAVNYFGNVQNPSAFPYTEPVRADTRGTRQLTLLSDIPPAQTNSIVTEGFIEVTGPRLTSVSLTAFMNAENIFAIAHEKGTVFAPDGTEVKVYEHELVLFQTAELVGGSLFNTLGNTYRLRNYVRGYRGGEHLANNAVIAANNPSMVLINDGVFMDSAAGDVGGLGDVIQYIAYPTDANPDSPRRAVSRNRLEGTPVKPFSPVNLHRVSDSYVFGWTRRSRSFDSNDWGATDPSLVENEEKYRVQVLDSNKILIREVVATSRQFTYTDAQRNTDFGTSTPTNFYVQVCQIGDFLDSEYAVLFVGD